MLSIPGGQTPLHEKAYYGNDRVVRTLLGAGADVNRNIDGTPLFLQQMEDMLDPVEPCAEWGAQLPSSRFAQS
jgi:hypothetical protein